MYSSIRVKDSIDIIERNNRFHTSFRIEILLGNDKALAILYNVGVSIVRLEVQRVNTICVVKKQMLEVGRIAIEFPETLRQTATHLTRRQTEDARINTELLERFRSWRRWRALH